MKTTTQHIRKLKGERPIVALTAYDTITAALLDRAGVDLILVGDSVGTTLLGYETTVPVTMDMMAHHTAAVARARPSALVVADIPFAEARHSFDRFLDSCVRLMQQCGAEAVKVEGGRNVAPVIEKLVLAGVPVLGHIGLLPQRYYSLGGYRSYGKTESDRKRLIEDAKALEDAGVFAIVGESINEAVAKDITQAIKVPFIGIGCGSHCDGQILVTTDLLGLNLGHYPSFAKPYTNLADQIRKAVSKFSDDVRSRAFPANLKE